MRFVYLSLFSFILMVIVACGGNAASMRDVVVRDTIYSSYGGNDFLSGIRVYRNDLANRESDNVYLCLFNDNEDTLTVVADLHPSNFSLGGPYDVQKDEVLRKKFFVFKDSVRIYQDRMDVLDKDEDDGPPYFFSVIIGNDTIDYIADLHKTNCYGFYEARLYDSRFRYSDYCVGRSLKDCALAKYVPNEILEKIRCVEMRSCCDYKVPSNKKKVDAVEFQQVNMEIEKGKVKSVYIFGEI